MAGDWIKMRSNLWDDPRVARLCDMTDSGECAIVGALYWLWSAADQHSEDGVMPGLTLRSIDRKTGIHGFGSALVAIGWLADHPEGVRIVRFEEHNGSSAKRRCVESKRKMSARDADKVRTECSTIEDKSQQSCAPRERVREEVNHHSETTTSTTEPPSTETQPSSLSSSALDRCKTLADRLTKLESGRGLDFKIRDSNPNLREWVKAGITDPQLREAYDLAIEQRRRDQDGGAINPKFLHIFVLKVMSDEAGPSPAITVKAWHESASGIEAKAVELGLSRRFDEGFPAFKERVFAAAGLLAEAA